MNAKLTLARLGFLPCFIAALLSAVISAGLLGAVSGLFHSDGIPFGRVVAAERTCRDHAFGSQREECVRRELAGPIGAMIASAPCGPLRQGCRTRGSGETPARRSWEARRPHQLLRAAVLLGIRPDVRCPLGLNRQSRGKRSSLCES